MSETIYDYAETLVKRGQAYVHHETPRKVYFKVLSRTLLQYIEVVYDIDKNKFLPCLSPHGDTMEGGFVQALHQKRCRHMLACAMVMDQNGMTQRFAERRAQLRGIE